MVQINSTNAYLRHQEPGKRPPPEHIGTAWEDSFAKSRTTTVSALRTTLNIWKT